MKIENLIDFELYLFFVPVLGLLIGWALRGYVIRMEQKRKQRLHRKDAFDFIESGAPIDDPEGTARKRGLANIKSRYRFIRRSLLVAIVVLTGVFVALPFLGAVPAAYVSFFLGSATVLLGIAARPFVENVISGVVISLGRRVRLGDTVLIDGNFGTIEEITLTYIVVKLWDWTRFIVPNQSFLQKDFLNYTLMDNYLWAYVEVWASYESDVEQVREIAINAMKTSQYCRSYEEPAFWVMDMDKNGYRCWVAGWSDSATEAWLLRNEVRTSILRQFRERGIVAHSYRVLDGSPSNFMGPLNDQEPAKSNL